MMQSQINIFLFVICLIHIKFVWQAFCTPLLLLDAFQKHEEVHKNITHGGPRYSHYFKKKKAFKCFETFKTILKLSLHRESRWWPLCHAPPQTHFYCFSCFFSILFIIFIGYYLVNFSICPWFTAQIDT